MPLESLNVVKLITIDSIWTPDFEVSITGALGVAGVNVTLFWPSTKLPSLYLLPSSLALIKNKTVPKLPEVKSFTFLIPSSTSGACALVRKVAASVFPKLEFGTSLVLFLLKWIS